jgi:glycerate 2-kinase
LNKTTKCAKAVIWDGASTQPIPTEVHADVLKSVDSSLANADPYLMVKRYVRFDGVNIVAGGQRYNLHNFKRLFVVGAGKASARMAVAIEDLLGEKIYAGLVIVPHTHKGLVTTQRIGIGFGSHPSPDRSGFKNTERMLEMVGKPSADDLVLCLISGGGSSLLALPFDGISLEDVTNITLSLQKSGADIYELNVVRKHLSAVQGGRLAERLYPASVITMIVSDVVGNDLSTIASGPTTPDPSTFRDAVSILKKRNIWDTSPISVKRLLEMGVSGSVSETPKPSSHVFRRVQNILIGDNFDACAGARSTLQKKGYRTFIMTTQITGEAKGFGRILSSISRGIADEKSTFRRPVALIFGGETTVKVQGNGKGGRNQEVVLSACKGIYNLHNIVVCSFGTDGIDGVTDVAGGIIDGTTFAKAETNNLDIDDFLENNDSYSCLKITGSLLKTGVTCTNVGDVTILAAGVE